MNVHERMRNTATPTLALCALAAFAIALATNVRTHAAQPGGDARSNGPTRPTTGVYAVRDLEVRLARLDGSDPMADFMLGEDIAAVAESSRAFDLARELFVLAWETDRRAGDAGSLGASVCIALADLSTGGDRRWLLALAGSLDAEGDAVAPWMAPSLNAVASDAGHGAGVASGLGEGSGLELAEALGRVRAGFGARAAQELESDDIEQALERVGFPARDAARLRTIVDEVLKTPRCPRCKNDRVVRAAPDSDQRYELCPDCGGHPGPALTDGDLAIMLRAEAMLLGVGSNKWSAQSRIDGAAPIRALDPGALAALIDLDPDARRYVFEAGNALNGRWE